MIEHNHETCFSSVIIEIIFIYIEYNLQFFCSYTFDFSTIANFSAIVFQDELQLLETFQNSNLVIFPS